jgi:hypothetical protein
MITSVLAIVAFGILNSGSADIILPRWTLILFIIIAAALLVIGAIVVRIGSPDQKAEQIPPSTTQDDDWQAGQSSSMRNPAMPSVRIRGVVRFKRRLR